MWLKSLSQRRKIHFVFVAVDFVFVAPGFDFVASGLGFIALDLDSVPSRPGKALAGSWSSTPPPWPWPRPRATPFRRGWRFPGFGRARRGGARYARSGVRTWRS